MVGVFDFGFASLNPIKLFYLTRFLSLSLSACVWLSWFISSARDFHYSSFCDSFRFPLPRWLPLLLWLFLALEQFSSFFKTKSRVNLDVGLSESVENMDLIKIIVVCNRCTLDYTCIVRIVSPIIRSHRVVFFFPRILPPSLARLTSNAGFNFNGIECHWCPPVSDAVQFFFGQNVVEMKYDSTSDTNAQPFVFEYFFLLSVFNQNESHKKSN